MNTVATSNLARSAVFRILPWLECGLLIALAIGMILAFMKINSPVILISLGGLSIAFFLYAYRPADLERPEGEKFGFTELLALIVLPKAMWIGCSVATVGILFFLLQFGNEGYKQMLLIGCSTLAFGLILIVAFLVMGVKGTRTLIPVSFRALPLALVAFYILTF